MSDTPKESQRLSMGQNPAEKIQVRVVAVNKSTDRRFYEDAEAREIGLMYTPQTMEVKKNASQNEFLGEYYVPPERAMQLYELICKDTPPDRIVSELNLERKSSEVVMGMVMEWVKSRHVEETKNRERRDYFSDICADIRVAVRDIIRYRQLQSIQRYEKSIIEEGRRYSSLHPPRGGMLGDPHETYPLEK